MCRKEKPADGSQGSDFIDGGRSPASILGVEVHKQEGNNFFEAGKYKHAAISYACGLSMLDQLGMMPTSVLVHQVMSS